MVNCNDFQTKVLQGSLRASEHEDKRRPKKEAESGVLSLIQPLQAFPTEYTGFRTGRNKKKKKKKESAASQKKKESAASQKKSLKTTDENLGLEFESLYPTSVASFSYLSWVLFEHREQVNEG